MFYVSNVATYDSFVNVSYCLFSNTSLQLSDVERGGNTAFPMAGVAAKPVKGSAVYWYNLLSSGERDNRTWHGACPVVLGEKWGMINSFFDFIWTELCFGMQAYVLHSNVILVSNKWIRLYDQMHIHQCHPSGRVPLSFEVNGKPLQFNDYDQNLVE